MSAIDRIKQINPACTVDHERPASLVVRQAEWLTYGPAYTVCTQARFPQNLPRFSGLVIDLAPESGLVPGGKVLFLNTSDPRAVWPADAELQQAIRDKRVGVLEVPCGDNGPQPYLSIQDQTAREALGLTPGCSFEIKQMDRAGNVSAGAAEIVLCADGAPVQLQPEGKPIGDGGVFGQGPRYVRGYDNDPNRVFYAWNNGRLAWTHDYSSVRTADQTPAVFHPEHSALFYDVKSDAVSFSGARAIERRSSLEIKTLTPPQQTYSAQADDQGNFSLNGIALSPGECFHMKIRDRHGVESDLGDGVIHEGCSKE